LKKLGYNGMRLLPLIKLLFFYQVDFFKQIFQWFLTLMGKYFNIAVAAFMALAMTGCGSGGEQAGNPNPSSSPTPSSAPTSPAASQPFNNPVVAAKPGSQAPDTIVGTPNLIQTTNATERLLVVSKAGSERDPFAQITPPYPTVSNNTEERKSVPVLPGVPTGNSGNSGSRVAVVVSKSKTRSQVLTTSTRVPYIPYIPRRKITTVASIKRGFTPVLPKIMPQVVPNTSLIAVLPPAMQPELAKGVVVTGVVMVGRTPQAIIKVPTEPTSRYVQAGDRLSGGLLVKRIEMNEGSDPIVIFEQFGIEVARMVGEGATSPATTAGNNSAPATNTPAGV
jgi:hypothetical protein